MYTLERSGEGPRRPTLRVTSGVPIRLLALSNRKGVHAGNAMHMALHYRIMHRYARRRAVFHRMIESMLPATGLTALQLAAIAHRGSNAIVEGLPGAGKTRVIVERCRSLLAAGIPAGALLVLTSQRAATELRARITTQLSGALPLVYTFHGFASWLVDQSEPGGGQRRISRAAQREVFAYAAASTGLTSLPPYTARSAHFLALAEVRADELRESPAAARRKLAEHATPRLRDIIELEASRDRLRERLDIADDAGVVAQAVELAGRAEPRPARILLQRYKHILIDEFQDADATQLALLQHLHGEIFAVGDRNQTIYAFRRSAQAAQMQARAALAMTVFRLGPSLRCPAEISDFARSGRLAASSAEVAAAGAIRFRRAVSPRDEAALVGQCIAGAVAAGTPAGDIAVLLRNPEPMTRLLERELRSRGVAVAERSGRAVLDDPAVDVIRAAFTAFAAPDRNDGWIELLSHPALAIPPLELRLAVAATPLQSLEAVSALLETLDVRQVDGTARVHGVHVAAALRAAHLDWQRNDVQSAARVLAAELNLSRCALLDGGALDAFFGAVADVCDVRARLQCDTSAAANFGALLDGSRSLRTASAAGASESGVHIMSVHAAKGREFEFVIIADAAAGRFPDNWQPDQVLGAHDFAAARGCGVDVGTLVDEHAAAERALWCVALTRTKRNLLVTWSETAIDGSPQRASRFIPLDVRDGQAQRPAFRAPLDDRSTGIRDVQSPSPARLTRAVAVSTLETWLTCRRRFYYSALLRVGGSQRSFKAKLGTLVHRAIQEFHSAVRDFTHVEAGAHADWSARLQDAVATVLASIDRPFEPFESALETSAAIRAANRLVGRYARELERAARDTRGFAVIASEKRVDFSLAGIAFTGKIDRVDAFADGTLALVDIKTGAFAKDKAMADGFRKLGAAAQTSLWVKAPSRVNPQLALYRLAIAARTLAFVYLDAASKADDYADAAYTDRLVCVDEQPALAAIDAVTATTFSEPWATGAVRSLDPTRFARSCRSCEFTAVCPGYLEDDEP